MNITLRSSTLHKEDHYVQKVKAKAYKQACKTPYELLASAEQKLNRHNEPYKEANKGFLRKERFVMKEKGKDKHVLVLPIIRAVAKVNSVGAVAEDNMNTVNHLLRRILVFKGHHFDDIHQAVREKGKQTYAVNTQIVVHDGSLLPKIFKVSDITVKKTFMNVVSDCGMPKIQRCIFFDSKCCEKLNFWLNSLSVKFEL